MKTKEEQYKFGKRLAELRKSAGLTQKNLGEKIGVSQRVIAYYECETNYPPALLLPKIAKELSVSIDELFPKSNNKQINKEKSKLWRKLRKIEELEPEDQKAILKMIERLGKK